ncbi:MAG: transketolase [Veillonella sp.]|uniref:transketolase n=1 Tax=Veillonella caviae TaxID=248316 RepID=UPI000F8DA72B|nr:transketolase [Veillonella caviae]MCF0158198.1 transketolase [Veillonella sp.]
MATLTQEQLQLVEEKAKAIRVSIVKSVTAAKSGHPGGSLSIADVMALLYFVEMNVDPTNPKAQNRDRFVLSKGHAAPALYATLAEKGFFLKDELLNLRKIDHILQGHPDMKHTPGVDMSTGSLGQGISAACGMALAGKIDNANYRVYSILGDGELEEGQVWEAAMFAGHYKLNNLTAFVDFNGLQIDGDITKVLSPLPIPEKFKAFQWNVIEVNGHNIDALHNAIESAKSYTEGPTCIVMHTIKGKGVDEMEGQAGWHGKAPSAEQGEAFINEIMGV